MKTIRNRSSSERTIAETGDVVESGGSVEVPDELADSLLEQGDVWGAGDVHACPDCPFEAKSEGGLTTHRKTHESEDA